MTNKRAKHFTLASLLNVTRKALEYIKKENVY